MRPICAVVACVLTLSACDAIDSPPAGEADKAQIRVETQGIAATDGVVVPDVTGLSFEEARSALFSAGLGLSPSSKRRSHDAAPNHVLSQEPAPGSTAEPGSEVHLTIAVAPRGTRLDDLATHLQLEEHPVYAHGGVEVRLTRARLWSASVARRFSRLIDFRMNPQSASIVAIDVVLTNRSDHAIDLYAEHAQLQVGPDRAGPNAGIAEKPLSGLQLPSGATRRGVLVWTFSASVEDVLRTGGATLHVLPPSDAKGAAIGPPIKHHISWPYRGPGATALRVARDTFAPRPHHPAAMLGPLIGGALSGFESWLVRRASADAARQRASDGRRLIE